MKPRTITEKNECIEALTKALNELVHLHLCEQEGISSGQPTRDQWLKAVDEASATLEKYK